jgi:molybdopterin converting factor small subunit
MSVKVMIPTPLRVYAGKRDSAEFSAATVGEALGGLTSQFAELRKHLYTEDGKLRAFVNVYLNDEDIRYLAKEDTPTKDGDTISIIPSIAGGCLNTLIDRESCKWPRLQSRKP